MTKICSHCHIIGTHQPFRAIDLMFMAHVWELCYVIIVVFKFRISISCKSWTPVWWKQVFRVHMSVIHAVKCMYIHSYSHVLPTSHLSFILFSLCMNLCFLVSFCLHFSFTIPHSCSLSRWMTFLQIKTEVIQFLATGGNEHLSLPLFLSPPTPSPSPSALSSRTLLLLLSVFSWLNRHEEGINN